MVSGSGFSLSVLRLCPSGLCSEGGVWRHPSCAGSLGEEGPPQMPLLGRVAPHPGVGMTETDGVSEQLSVGRGVPPVCSSWTGSYCSLPCGSPLRGRDPPAVAIVNFYLSNLWPAGHRGAWERGGGWV